MTSATPLGLRRSVGLADYTTWRVGGSAQWFAEPESALQLQALLAWAQAEGLPSLVIGAGSNLLVSDAGLEGLTLCNRRLQGAALDASTGLIEAQAGEPIPSLARRAARAGLSGLEWSVGIPGTVGGAAVMNAGAQGGCTAEVLDSVTVIEPHRPNQPFELRAGELVADARDGRSSAGAGLGRRLALVQRLSALGTSEVILPGFGNGSRCFLQWALSLLYKTRRDFGVCGMPNFVAMA
jgi:UDP-N-acetylmuramate dehydrogenase